jgi:hypothetical protein
LVAVAEGRGLSGGIESLRAENAVLKHRAEAAEAVAQERQARIEDLLAALRMLPAAWADRPGSIASDPSTEAPMAGLDPHELARAEVAWAETRRLRERLDRELLARETERLGSRRKRRVARR